MSTPLAKYRLSRQDVSLGDTLLVVRCRFCLSWRVGNRRKPGLGKCLLKNVPRRGRRPRRCKDWVAKSGLSLSSDRFPMWVGDEEEEA